MTAPIYVIGSGNVDHIMKMPRLPAKGETVTDGVYLPTFGGKGANSAVAAAKAGGTVEFVGCVGEDSGGTALRAELQRFGVGVKYLQTVQGVATGQALVMVGSEGGNYLSVAPGANHRMTPEHALPVLNAIAPNACVLLQNEIPASVNRAVLAIARQRGFRCLFNFAPVVDFPMEELDGIAYLLVNENEANALLAAKGLQPMDEADPTGAALTLCDYGIQCVVITLGAAGAVVAESKRAVHIPAIKVRAIDTTAAGDTFSGAFAVALAEGADPLQAARFANCAAALSVTRNGAMISSPQRQEIAAWLETAKQPNPA